MNLEETIENHTIQSEESILHSLEKMDAHGVKNLIVVSDGRAVGVLTDGDLRRAFLKGRVLGDPVSSAMKIPFIYLNEGATPQEIISKFHNNSIGIVPVIDEQGILKNIITRQIFDQILLSKDKLSTDFVLTDYDHEAFEGMVFSRPWGYYKTMVLNEMFQSKVIYVMPGQKLSLQSHKRREEHWTIINGTGSVQLDDSIRNVYPGDSIFIPKGCKHRITNISSSEMLIFSEIQIGDYFGEDDITRYDDDYGRL